MRLVLRRLAVLPLVIFGASVLIFVAGRVATANPSTTAISIHSTPEVREQFIKERHLDEALLTQYWLWLNGVVHGDFGRSLITFQPVSESIARGLGVTVALGLGAFVLAAVIGLGLGTVSGLSPGGPTDRIVTAFCVLGVSVPTFFLGLLLIQSFAVQAGVLPAGGYVPLREDPIAFVHHMILPWVTLALPAACIIARVTRARVAGELNRPHVLTARALGVAPWRRVSRYVLRNSLVEPIAILGIQLGLMLGGVVITERIYALPGLGSAAIQAADQGDFPMLQGTALLAMVMVVTSSLIADVLHAASDRGIARDG